KVYSPWIMQNLSRPQIDKLSVVKKSYFAMSILILIGVVWGIAARSLLPMLVGEEFIQAGRIVIFISLGYSLTGLYYIVTNYIFYAEKTKLLTIITLISGVINIP